jgi:hypothetical protein
MVPANTWEGVGTVYVAGIAVDPVDHSIYISKRSSIVSTNLSRASESLTRGIRSGMIRLGFSNDVTRNASLNRSEFPHRPYAILPLEDHFERPEPDRPQGKRRLLPLTCASSAVRLAPIAGQVTALANAYLPAPPACLD